MPRRKLAWLAAFPALALFSGCNKIRLGYEYGDWLVILSVKRNFDPDNVQLERLNRDVEEYFRWNRREMLPRYAEFLSRAVDGLRTGLRPVQFDSAYGEYRALHRETMAPVVDKAQILLLSLTPAQIDLYEKRMKKKNGRLRKEYAQSKEEALERRYRKTLAGIEDWTGRLSSEQRQKVRALSFALPWNGPAWLENREKTQSQLTRILKGNRDSTQLRQFLEAYFLFPERLRSPEYQERAMEFESGIRSFILALFPILTPKQKSRIFGQVEELAEDFRKMSRTE